MAPTENVGTVAPAALMLRSLSQAHQHVVVENLFANLDGTRLDEQMLFTFKLLIDLLLETDEDDFNTSDKRSRDVDERINRFVLDVARSKTEGRLIGTLIQTLQFLNLKKAAVLGNTTSQYVQTVLDDLEARIPNLFQLPPELLSKSVPAIASQLQIWLKQSGQDCNLHSIEVVANLLRFLRSFLCAAEYEETQDLLRVVKACIVCTVANSREISDAASHVMSAIFTSSDVRKLRVSNSTSQVEAAWFLLRDSLILSSNQTFMRTNVMTVFLILALDKSNSFSNIMGKSIELWQVIREGLTTGTRQQRAICLATFKHFALVESDGLKLYVSTERDPSLDDLRNACTRYVTLFEIIVLGQHSSSANLVLPGLTSLAMEPTTIKPIWLMAFMKAAMHEQMPEAIRRPIGCWIRDHGVGLIVRSLSDACSFLDHYFLPWLSSGSLFTSLTRCSKNTVICHHGERTANFICQLLRQTSEHVLKASIFHTILQFLVEKDNRILSYARAFMLQGVLQAVTYGAIPCVGNTLGLINQLTTVTNFQPIASDLMTVQSFRLLEACSPCRERDSSFARLENRVIAMTDTTTQAGSGATVTQASMSARLNRASDLQNIATKSNAIKEMSQETKSTQSLNVRGHDLTSNCRRMLAALDEVEKGCLDVDDFWTVLDAIWQESCRQSQPRAAVLYLPYVVLHRRVLETILLGSQFQQKHFVIFSDLAALGKHRIYVFSGLAEAIHASMQVAIPAVAQLLEHLVSQFAQHPPTASAEIELEAIMATKMQELLVNKTYHSYYGPAQACGYAYALHMINGLPMGDHYDAMAQRLLDKLLVPWLSQREPTAVFSPWKNTTFLQVIILLLERVMSMIYDNKRLDYLQQITTILRIELVPRFRYLLEWAVVRLYLHLPEALENLPQALSTMEISNAKFVVSFIKVALSLAFSPRASEAYAVKLFTQLVILSSSQKIALRHEAQSSIPPLWDRCMEERWCSAINNEIFKQFNDYIRSLDVFRNPPSGHREKFFHPVEDHNLTNLVAGTYLKLEPREEPRLNFSHLQAIHASKAVSQDKVFRAMPVSCEKLSGQRQTPEGDETSLPNAVVATTAFTPVQTKGDITALHLSSLLNDTAMPKRRTRDIHVIASLVNIGFNLGGISRVSEAFGAKAMHVTRKDVVKSPDFKSVSVSSETWLPIEQLVPNDLLGFFVERKREGYSIVGIEQTDSSKILGQDEYVLPQKIVLVIGSEADGIPARLLAEMDLCIEIKQMGMTRSLNVQTATAIVLYQYSKQYP